MSGTTGKSEAFGTSTKKESSADYRSYRFAFVKRIVDRLFAR